MDGWLLRDCGVEERRSSQIIDRKGQSEECSLKW